MRMNFFLGYIHMHYYAVTATIGFEVSGKGTYFLSKPFQHLNCREEHILIHILVINFIPS